MPVGSLKFAQCSALPGGCVASPSGAFFRGEPDERGRATRSFRSKRADTIAAGPLDSTQATRAAHAAQSGCAATVPLTGRRGGRGVTGGSQPGYREKWSWPQMNGRPHRPRVLFRADPSRHSGSTWRSHAASWPANKKSATRSRAARRRATTRCISASVMTSSFFM